MPLVQSGHLIEIHVTSSDYLFPGLPIPRLLLVESILGCSSSSQVHSVLVAATPDQGKDEEDDILNGNWNLR